MFPTVLVPQKQTKGGVFLFRDHSDAHRAASLSDFQRALVSRLGCTRMNSRPGRSLEGRITVMPYDVTTEPQAAALSDPVVFHRGAQTGISETGLCDPQRHTLLEVKAYAPWWSVPVGRLPLGGDQALLPPLRWASLPRAAALPCPMWIRRNFLVFAAQIPGETTEWGRPSAAGPKTTPLVPRSPRPTSVPASRPNQGLHRASAVGFPSRGTRMLRIEAREPGKTKWHSAN